MMRASGNIGKLCCRIIETELGEHVLFRDYGLAVTDDAAPLSRTTVQSKIAQYYPETTVKSFELIEADSTGTFKFNIDVDARG